MDITTWLKEYAASHPAPDPLPSSDDPRPEVFRCAKCRDANVANLNDICELCTLETKRGYIATTLLGRLANGAERDHGRVVHGLAIDKGNGKKDIAFCGAKPGRRSVGWSWHHEKDVTCPRCLKRISKLYPTQESTNDNS